MKKILCLLLCMVAGFAHAESGWVVCQPDSKVNIRQNPHRNSEVVAWGYMGDEIELDGRKSGVWLHCIIPCETGEGWIRKDYVSTDPPEELEEGIYIIEKNKTLARTSIGGKVRKKLKAGQTVEVYMVTALWCITEEGFIKTSCMVFQPKGDNDAESIFGECD